MLISRNLDDQDFEGIMQEAKGRLPWICPVWTDHNEHDPGITILELMAWFKETQQFQMNQVTPEMGRRLLALAGVGQKPAAPAVCALRPDPEMPGYPARSRLISPQDVPFELMEDIPERRPVLQAMRIERTGGRGPVELTNPDQAGPAFAPFDFAGESGTALLLGFSNKPEGSLKLWFQVQQPPGAMRNPADADTEMPRTLVWEFSGCRPVKPEADETLALSWSGYVTLPVPKSWKPGEGDLYWLRISQKEAGCEEHVRLLDVGAGRYLAVQTKTDAAAYGFTVTPGPDTRAEIISGQALACDTAVFIRDQGGWRQTREYKTQKIKNGLAITLDTSGAADDGEENLLAVCMDPVRIHDLLFDTKGRPGEHLRLNPGDQKILVDRLRLMCMTLYPDGKIRPAIWHPVDSLMSCGPRDRAFVYDDRLTTVSFGDGKHGAIPAAGEGSVMVIDQVLSWCASGNLSADAGFIMERDGLAMPNEAASGGREAQTITEARGELMLRLKDTHKCLSTADYEACARRTPGLRVAGARALPGFDPEQPHQHPAAMISVAVLPAGESAQPTADARFLAAVDRQLDRNRTICIRTKAIPVRYIPFRVSVRLRASKDTQKKAIEEAVRQFYLPCEARIGAPAARDDLAAWLQKTSGVYHVSRIEFHSSDQNSYQASSGDLVIPEDGILFPEKVDLVFDGR